MQTSIIKNVLDKTAFKIIKTSLEINPLCNTNRQSSVEKWLYSGAPAAEGRLRSTIGKGKW